MMNESFFQSCKNQSIRRSEMKMSSSSKKQGRHSLIQCKKWQNFWGGLFKLQFLDMMGLYFFIFIIYNLLKNAFLASSSCLTFSSLIFSYSDFSNSGRTIGSSSSFWSFSLFFSLQLQKLQKNMLLMSYRRTCYI